MKHFFDFYKLKFSNKDISCIYKEFDTFRATLKSIKDLKDEDKTQDIPKEYFNRYLATAVKVMNSNDADINDRGIACLMVLLSQTGLREGQLRTLKINALREISILDGEKTAFFMKFVISKRKDSPVGETFLNPLAYRAYTTLVDIFKEHRKKIKSDFLYTPTTLKEGPITPNTLSKHMIKFCLLHAEEIGCINVSDKYPELQTLKCDSNNNGAKQRVLKLFIKEHNKYHNDVISFPNCHQFRVHLCTELYFAGVNLEVIQHYMSHLSKDMTDYYIRHPEYSAKEEEFATSVLKTIIEEGTKPLGVQSDALISKIDEFIEKGSFNIEKDIDSIISGLKRRMPIKEKLGGICIKSGPKRDCSKDAMTDEFYCAYGVCANHFHLYTMANITYTRCKAIVKTMEHN